MEEVKVQRREPTFEVNEVFMSLEGEGPHSLRPTAYIRFGRCNLKCPGFNNPTIEKTDSGYAPIGFDPKDYNSLEDIPLITKGCDSQYAVNPAFSHMWEKLTLDQLVDKLISVLPGGNWIHPITQQRVILSLTGGEPTLLWKRIPEILNHPKMVDCKHVLIETNCTVPFQDEFINQISSWLSEDDERLWTWSNSPKLTSSGEPWAKAIKPVVAARQATLFEKNAGQVEQYFKFVVGHSEADYSEVTKAMDEYYQAGIATDTEIWVMPQACTQEQQEDIARLVAEESMKRGWFFSFRIQNALWGNGVGT